MSSTEYRGFTFALVFIVIFGTLLATCPTGLQGPGESGNMVVPVNPSLISDFSDSVHYVRANFTYYRYYYDLGGRSWWCQTDDAGFIVLAKVLLAGFLWFGGYDMTTFVLANGSDRGTYLSISEIQADAINGEVRYNLKYVADGNTAGGFVAYWNTTAYPLAANAWTANKLYLLHGVGISTSATANIGALLIHLLFVQLPDVPLLVNILIAVPIWASLIYLLWYIIKEMIPFV